MNISDRKKRLLWQVPFLCFLIAGTVYIIRQQQDAPYQHNRGAIFGTTTLPIKVTTIWKKKFWQN